VLLDAEPDPGDVAPPQPPAAAEDDGHHALGGLPHAVAGAARAGAGIARHPRRLGDTLHRSRALAEVILKDELLAAPKSSLNAPIGTMRRYEVVRVPLADLKAIKSELGGTVNDVVLAAASGGLRRLLLERGELPPERGLRAMVPVNVRAAGEHLALGNRITSLFVHLPVDEEEPLTRYRRAVAETEALKSGNQAVGGATLIELAGHAPPVLHSALAQSLFASRLFNVTITNVPGPQQPLYALGSRLQEISGLVPLAAEHAVGICILSYDGNVTFGLIGDRDTMADLHVLRGGIEEALDELRVLAGTALLRA
jgi:WS/DGAT/MGAT family acyltransferase